MKPRSITEIIEGLRKELQEKYGTVVTPNIEDLPLLPRIKGFYPSSSKKLTRTMPSCNN